MKPLLLWVVEQGSSTAVALAIAGHSDEITDAASASLALLPMMCPRLLLDAVPDAVAVLVRAAHRLTEPHVDINESVETLLTCLLIAIKMLALVDPPALRRLDGVAGTLASAYATLPTGADAGRGAAGAAVTLHEIFKLLAAAPDAFAASPGGLALLVKWAGLTNTPDQQWMADTAVAVSLFVGVQHLLAGEEGGAARLPATLRGAGATWVHVAATHPSPTAAQSGRMLALLFTYGADALGGVQEDASWANEFPKPALSIFNEDAYSHCWTCGSPRRADAPATAPANLLGQALRSCAGFRVAAYCSAACAGDGSRRGGQKAACRRWASYRSKAVPELVAARAAEPVLGAGVSTRQALFPVTSIRVGGFAGPRNCWTWPAGAALRVESAGLVLADVVCVADPGSSSILLVPAPEYAHWTSTVPTAAMAAPLACHAGRVLRVVVREHPPIVPAYGFPRRRTTSLYARAMRMGAQRTTTHVEAGRSPARPSTSEAPSGEWVGTRGSRPPSGLIGLSWPGTLAISALPSAISALLVTHGGSPRVPLRLLHLPRCRRSRGHGVDDCP